LTGQNEQNSMATLRLYFLEGHNAM